jgi:hypothetical protein
VVLELKAIDGVLGVQTRELEAPFNLDYAHDQCVGRWSLFNDAIRV